jgi:hypothetical protein
MLNIGRQYSVLTCMWNALTFCINVFIAVGQCDSLARKPKYSLVSFKFLYGSLWKLTWTRLRLSKQNNHSPQRIGLYPWCRDATAKQVFDSAYSDCVWRKYVHSWTALFVNTGERVHLNNVKRHFGIRMVKEVYRQNPVFTKWWIN